MTKPAAKWTPDCSGKQDFDGPIIDISTRYWPRGGGFLVLTPDRQWQGNEQRPEIRPSAHASILLRHDDDEYETLAEAKFEADTEGEVKAQVEQWAQARFDEIAAALRKLFTPNPKEGT